MILVTGGTGLVGAHLLYHLLQEHSSVRAIHRASSDLNYVREVFSFYTSNPDEIFNRIEWREANITRIPELTLAFEGISRVYHCAAFISFNPKHYEALKKANVDGTANVVNLCLSNNIDKLCYVSSVATLSEAEGDTDITEKNLWNPEENNSVYSITKYGAEMEVWRGSQEGLKSVIINPGVIFGEGFWNSGSGMIIQRAAKGIPFYTDGSAGFVDVRDVVEIMISLMNSNISRERFVLVSENASYKNLIDSLSQLFQKPLPKRSFPKAFLYFLSSLDGISSTFLGTKRMLLKATVRSLFTHANYSSEKIKKVLDYNFIPLQDTLTRVVSAYQKTNPSQDR